MKQELCWKNSNESSGMIKKPAIDEISTENTRRARNVPAFA